MKVIKLQSVGSCYQNGRRMSGWGSIILEDGSTIYCKEEGNYFNKMIEIAEGLGHDCSQVKTKY